MNRKRHSTQLGQDLIEYAITLPLFMLIIFGILDFGRGIYYFSAMYQGARDGARYGSVHPEAPFAEVIAQVEPWLIGLDSDLWEIIDCSTGTTSCVAVKYTFRAVTPFIGRLLEDENEVAGQLTLRTRSTMPLEYIP
jgi:hypothetical protein